MLVFIETYWRERVVVFLCIKTTNTIVSGIRVNSVNPGPVATDFLDNMGVEISFDFIKEMTALKRVSTSEEIGELILFLASDKAKGITGSIMVTDNGCLLKH